MKAERLKKILKINRLLAWTRKTRIPMYSVSIYDVVYYFIKSLLNPYFNLRASAMAFGLFFSIFPIFMLLFTILPWLPFPDLKLQLTTFMESVFPSQSIGLIESVVSQAFKKKGMGIISLGIVLAFWSATSGVLTMMDSFRRQDVEFNSKRNSLVHRFIALFVFVLLMLLIAFYGYFMNLADYYLAILKSYTVLSWIPEFLRIVVSLGCISFCVSVIYYIAPTQHKWSLFTIGSVLTGVLLAVMNSLLKFFFTHATTYDKIYGSIASVAIVMMWFYWLSIVLLIGYELNIAIDKAIDKSSSVKLSENECHE